MNCKFVGWWKLNPSCSPKQKRPLSSDGSKVHADGVKVFCLAAAGCDLRSSDAHVMSRELSTTKGDQKHDLKLFYMGFYKKVGFWGLRGNFFGGNLSDMPSNI